tara:strand:- start:295 stop:735 length:441 start_codon:yes stop_codon:yes gene_type:complete
MSSGDIYFDDVELGDEIGPLTRSVSSDQVVGFVSVRDPDPSLSRFTSDKAARSEGLPGAIVPGAMNIAMMSQIVTGWSSTVSLKKIDVVFRQMVPHNEPLTLSGIVTDKDETGGSTSLECDIVMENREGVKLVIGHAEFTLPSRPQ